MSGIMGFQLTVLVISVVLSVIGLVGYYGSKKAQK